MAVVESAITHITGRQHYFTLQYPAGTGITMTAAGGSPCVHLPRYVRPSLGGTSGGDVDVTMLLRKTRN